MILGIRGLEEGLDLFDDRMFSYPQNMTKTSVQKYEYNQKVYWQCLRYAIGGAIVDDVVS